MNRHRWLLWLTALTLAGCQAPAQTVQDRPAVVAAGDARIVLRSPWARQLQAAVPYARRHIDHVNLDLFAVAGPAETLVMRHVVRQDQLDADVVFEGLARQTTYRVRATAYKAASEAPTELISAPGGSITEIGVGAEATTAIAALNVKLIDVPVTWGQVATLPLVNGALSLPAVTTGASVAGAALDALGNLYVADAGASRVAKITPTGEVSTYAGGINQPSDLAFGADGTLFAMCRSMQSLVQIPPGGGTAVPVSIAIPFPSGLACGPDGHLYTTSGPQVLRFAPGGSTYTVFAGGTQGTGDGTGGAAGFNQPKGLDFDRAGNLYVADTGNGALRRITPAQEVSTVAVGLGKPMDVAVGPDGDVFVADQLHRVVAVTPSGATRVVAGSGAPGSADGFGAAATFNAPVGIAVDPRGTLFVVDAANQAIRRIF